MTKRNVDARPIVFEGFDGLRLVGEIRGDPEAPPVLFLHGGGQTRHAWGATAEIVSAGGWSAITLDSRGHGDSDWALNGDYSFSAFRADCVAVIDQLKYSPVVVGASLGGISALMAEGMSDRPLSRGLVLVDITPKANPQGIKRIRDFMTSGSQGFDTLEQAAAAIASYTPQRKREASTEGLKKVLRARDGRWYWHWDPKFLQLERSQAASGALEEAVGNIHVPTMIVRGGLSDVVTQQGVNELMDRIADITVIEVGGAAHMIAGDKNAEFSDAVLAFLRDRVTQSSL